MSLKAYIESKNAFREIFGDDPISYPPSGAEVELVRDMIDCDLSPENLHCDGEISRTAAARKAKFYNAALKELAA